MIKPTPRPAVVSLTLLGAVLLIVGFMAGLFYQFAEVQIYDADARAAIVEGVEQDAAVSMSQQGAKYRAHVFDLEGEVAVLEYELRLMTARAEQAESVPDVEIIAVRMRGQGQ